ncbi:MAG: hypothetical protein ACPGSK_05340, partial [Alphaproteobacteria bacterium]
DRKIEEVIKVDQTDEAIEAYESELAAARQKAHGLAEETREQIKAAYFGLAEVDQPGKKTAKSKPAKSKPAKSKQDGGRGA